jgi:hypothetical protein
MSHGGLKQARSWKRRIQPKEVYSSPGLLYSEACALAWFRQLTSVLLLYNLPRGNRSPHLPAECPMTTHRLFRTFILSCAICTLALTVPECARAQDCYVGIYGYNHDYLAATVDTRGMGSNLFLENVSFEVTLHIKGTGQKAVFEFTDTDHRSLWSGRVYQGYIAPFPSGIPLQVEVGPGSCEYSRVLSWAKSDSLMSRANNREREPLRSNHPPAPGRVLGKVPPRSWH